MSDCSCGHKDIYRPELGTITKLDLMNQTELYMHIQLDSGAELDHEPGQFVEVSVAGIGEAPISISSSPTQKGFEMVIRAAGTLTNYIHRMKVGNKLGIRGPFGRGYPVEEMRGKDLVFICGGLGLVPQRSLINYVLDENNRDDYGDVIILFGARSVAERYYLEDLAGWRERGDVTLLETIDQPDRDWDGNVGLITTLIPKIETDFAAAKFLICGPPIMYKFVILGLDQKGTPRENIFVNLERRMKCGVGKCGHCQINYLYACQDGPVMRYSDLAAVPEAI